MDFSTFGAVGRQVRNASLAGLMIGAVLLSGNTAAAPSVDFGTVGNAVQSTQNSPSRFGGVVNMFEAIQTRIQQVLSDSKQDAKPVAKSAEVSAEPFVKPALQPKLSPLDKFVSSLDEKKPLSRHELAKQLGEVDPFIGLVAANEAYKDKPYYDGIASRRDLNVGFGYNISRQIAETDKARGAGEGRKKVIQDLTEAGVDETRIHDLLSNNKSKISSVRISQAEAVKLVDVIRDEYQAIAKKSIGSEKFETLPEHKQDALTYFAYNVGENMRNYKTLIRSVQKDDDKKALSAMTPTYKETVDGVDVQKLNHRLRSWVGALWIGEDSLKKALSNPFEHEGKFASADGLAHQSAMIRKPSSKNDTMLAKSSTASPIVVADVSKAELGEFERRKAERSMARGEGRVSADMENVSGRHYGPK